MQISRRRRIAEVCQGAVFLCLAGIKALQGNIERVCAVLQLHIFPGQHFRIVAHAHPGSVGRHTFLEHLHDFVVVQFHIHFVAHFNQQGDVIVGAEASVNAETGFNRLRIISILLFELLQSLAQGFFLLEVCVQPGLRLVQLFPGNFHCLLATYAAAFKCLDVFGLCFWRFLCDPKL